MIWFLNGRYLPSNQAKISVNDLAVLRGYGVFDFLVTYRKKPFLLEEHLDRLFASARQIDLPVPYTKSQIKKYVLQTIAKNKGKDFAIRLVVTGGTSSSNIFPEGKGSLAILVEKRVPYPPYCYRRGIRLKTYEYQRFIPGAKHINYLTAVVVKKKANRQGFLEVLFTHQGKILECTTSNFYLIKDKVLFTPKADILHGITKNVVLKLAREKIKVKQRRVLTKELKTADEAFISASDKEIMPVVQVDGLKIGNGRPGPLTRQIMQAFNKYTANFAKN